MFNFLEFSDKEHFFKNLQFLRVEIFSVFHLNLCCFFHVGKKLRTNPQNPKETTCHCEALPRDTLVSNNRGSERETPEHRLSPSRAIAFALGSGPDLPVVLVSGGKNPARVGTALCRHSYSPKSKQASIHQSGTWNVPCTSQHQGFPAFVCVRSHTGVVGNSEEVVTPTKKVLLM